MAENTAFHSYIQIGNMNWLKQSMCCLNPSWIYSMFSLLFSIQPLPVSVSDCRSESVWEGESKFFHGSSQPLAHSAAKWVTVYPLPQLRVLMCKCVYTEKVWICLCVCQHQNSIEGLVCSLFLCLSHKYIHQSSSLRTKKHIKRKLSQHAGILWKGIWVKASRYYDAEKFIFISILKWKQICKKCHFLTVFTSDNTLTHTHT